MSLSPIIPFRSRYGETDADSEMFLQYLQEPPCKVLEVGANQEYTANVLTDHGYQVTGVDLLPHYEGRVNYARIEGDFVQLADGLPTDFDVVYSTSAIEHFGLGGYGLNLQDPDYDQKAMAAMHRRLKPGGSCYITVPYGREFLVHGHDWRVYCRKSLEERIVQDFRVVKKLWFKSADALCPTSKIEQTIHYVGETDADAYSGEPPHVTVFLHLVK